MILFNYETDFSITDEDAYASWISNVLLTENKSEGEINYIFCDDEYLLQLNVDFLDHDTLTDIISFDYTLGNLISGDIFISIPRVQENAIEFQTTFDDELRRVIIHGVLHYCGYNDKSAEDEIVMRNKENEKLLLFHVKQ
jgi:probable rRNA maturation factor